MLIFLKLNIINLYIFFLINKGKALDATPEERE
jgi:hypothetical protein